MHCFVTAGPTIEPIDDVRRLTNHSTGRLGCRLADTLARAGHRVTLFLAETAHHQPRHRDIQIIRFNTTVDLRTQLRKAASPTIHAVFHAAAVSDYKVANPTKGKIPTTAGNLTLELKPNPKIIRSLRSWFPNAAITGWKYEVEGSRESALKNGAKQIQLNQTNACVVNGPAYGQGFGLINNESCTHLKTLQALSRALTPAQKKARRSRRA